MSQIELYNKQLNQFLTNFFDDESSKVVSQDS